MAKAKKSTAGGLDGWACNDIKSLPMVWFSGLAFSIIWWLTVTPLLLVSAPFVFYFEVRHTHGYCTGARFGCGAGRPKHEEIFSESRKSSRARTEQGTARRSPTTAGKPQSLRGGMGVEEPPLVVPSW